MLIHRNPSDPTTSCHINNRARRARPAVMGAAGIALSMMIVACGATYLPARRVARVDPLLALRE